MKLNPILLFQPVFYCGVLVTVMPVPQAYAEGGLVTDGTAGAMKSFTANEVNISQDLGTPAGGNLFHSFSQFNINTGQTVTFTENAPNSFNNVITRVTGGTQSDINGTLSVTPGGHANFFLLNPAGVFFGKDAVLDVAGAFHASTANQLKFSDGGLLNVDPTQGSSLSSAAPASFGFLASTRANNGLLRVEGATLEVKDGQTLDLVGGKINTDQATLNAPGGEIRLVATQGRGEVGLQRADGVLPLPKAMPTTSNAGKISSNDTFIKTTGDSGGRVGLWGGEVKITAQDLSSGQGIDAFNTGAIDAALQQGIDIKVEHLTLDGVRVRTESQKDGNAGDIRLQATQDIELLKSGRINSYTLEDSKGDSGSTKLSVGGNLLIDALNSPENSPANISTRAYDSSTGRVGNVNIITQGDVLLRAGGSIYSVIYDKHQGNTGDVSLSVGRDLLIDGQNSHLDYPTNISTRAYDESLGDTGDVNIQVGRNALLGKDGLIYSLTENNRGGGGNVNLHTQGDILTQAGSQIYSSIGTQDKAGNVSVTANRDITVGSAIFLSAEQGESTANIGKLTVTAGRDLNVLPDGQVITETTSNRNAANLEIYSGRNIKLEGDIKSISPTEISDGSPNVGIGSSGNMLVQAVGDIFLDKGYIGAPVNTHVKNKGGNINLSAGGNLTLTNKGASISTLTMSDNANGGNINISVQGNILLENGIVSIASDTSSKAMAGNINIIANGNLNLNNKGVISASTTAEGAAGNIFVDVKGNINLNQQGAILAASSATSDSQKLASGSAGKVDVHAQGSINLVHSYISAHTGGLGKGGDVIIQSDKDFQVKDHSIIGAYTDDNPGLAGSIFITSGDILVDNSQIIAGSYGTGSSGQTGQIDLRAQHSFALNRGIIGIQNEGNINTTVNQAITPSTLTLRAYDIKLSNSYITTQATGNVPAGFINISFDHWFNQEVSYIKTNAAIADGGAITITGGQLLSQHNSSIETTVTGGQGNGGPITVNADVLLMDTGLIQANANSGNGGDINLNIKAIIPSGDSLIVGGARVNWSALTPTFNVIQAVSETGVSGVPNITAPQLSLSGVLSNLGGPLFDSSILSPEYCNLGMGSTLVRRGRGGLKPKRDDIMF